MNIKELITTIKNKLETKFVIQNLKIEDKSFLHKKHKGHVEGKFHLKLTMKSEELNKMSKIDSNKKIFNILNFEIKHYIHSIQILIN
jgi:BolA family transcriptional regulator, general stress-responsive regulator|tara:strand:- start:614 stop:874 length:261 start_codon:yes stop_codon:yes gene_type:complete